MHVTESRGGVAEPRVVPRGRTEKVGAYVSSTQLYVILQDLTRHLGPPAKLWPGDPFGCQWASAIGFAWAYSDGPDGQPAIRPTTLLSY